MGGRRKRGNDSSDPHSPLEDVVVDLKRQIGHRVSSTDELQTDCSLSAESPYVDCSSFASRSSIRLIHEIVSKFNSQKIDLVKSIGFEGILQFPVLRQLNRKFELWLMSSVNPDSAILNIGPHIRLPIDKHDVSRVLGIPCSGIRILDPKLSTKLSKSKVLQEFLGDEFKENRSIKIVQEIVVRQYGDTMAKAESDRFRVAFVVFIVATLFSPSAKHDYACIDYWNAIQDPEAICNFDWSEYVLDRLFDAVRKLKHDISSNVKFPNIAGCSIFLQVLYLDSLDLGALTLPHKTLPRISDFSHQKLRAMISADQLFSSYAFTGTVNGDGKLRSPVGCIYSWSTEHSSLQNDKKSGCLLAIWESAVAMVHLLNIPLEAAGPLFVAAADFQEQINSGLNLTGIQAIKLMSVLVSIMIPYRRGIRHHHSNVAECPNGESPTPGLSVIDKAISSGLTLMSVPISTSKSPICHANGGQCLLHKNQLTTSCNMPMLPSINCASSNKDAFIYETQSYGGILQSSVLSDLASPDAQPHYLNVNSRVGTAISQFYSFLKKLKPARDFDLNTSASDICAPSHAGTSQYIMQPQSFPSPWDLGYSWGIDRMDTSVVINKVTHIGDDRRLIIEHSTPKYIQVSVGGFRSQLLGKTDMDPDLFDSLTRVLRQQDDMLYSPFGTMRWRHVFESDFMELLLSGSVDMCDPKLEQHLTNAISCYDLSKCSLFFFPAFLQCSWVCFVWSVQNNVIYVFEPCYPAPVPESRAELLKRLCCMLRVAICGISQSLSIGMSQHSNVTELRIITVSMNCRNRSGSLCSFFIRRFDGFDIVPKLFELDAEAVAANIFHEVFKLRDNLAILSHSISEA